MDPLSHLSVVLLAICVLIFCSEVVSKARSERKDNERNEALKQEWRVIREPFYIGFVYYSPRYEGDLMPSLLVFVDDVEAASRWQDFIDAIGGTYASIHCESLPRCGGIRKALDDASEFYGFDISKVSEVVSTCDYAVHGYIRGSFSMCERSRWPWRIYRESLT